MKRVGLRMGVAMWLWCAAAGAASPDSPGGNPGIDQGTPPGFAAELANAEPLPWASLSAEQRALLARFEPNWDAFPAARQQALARGTLRWLTMDETQRAQARQRFQSWRSLPPERRAAIRDNWQGFQNLSPEDKQRIRQDFRNFQQLNLERRRQLREFWLRQDAAERQRLLREMRQRRAQRPGR